MEKLYFRIKHINLKYLRGGRNINWTIEGPMIVSLQSSVTRHVHIYKLYIYIQCVFRVDNLQSDKQS